MHCRKGSYDFAAGQPVIWCACRPRLEDVSRNSFFRDTSHLLLKQGEPHKHLKSRFWLYRRACRGRVCRSVPAVDVRCQLSIPTREDLQARVAHLELVNSDLSQEVDRLEARLREYERLLADVRRTAGIFLQQANQSWERVAVINIAIPNLEEVLTAAARGAVVTVQIQEAARERSRSRSPRTIL